LLLVLRRGALLFQMLQPLSELSVFGSVLERADLLRLALKLLGVLVISEVGFSPSMSLRFRSNFQNIFGKSIVLSVPELYGLIPLRSIPFEVDLD
jgi:hypothetical protein